MLLAISSWSFPGVGYVCVDRRPTSGLGQNAADVPCDGPDRGHAAGVGHPGRPEDTQRGEHVVARPVAGRDHARAGELLVGLLVSDADREGAGAGRLAEELEEYDVLLECLEHRLDRPFEVVTEAGQVGR